MISLIIIQVFPGYSFEFAPTPLAAGGVGMFIDENVKYRIIEKISSRAFQALWVELQFEMKSNIICDIIYRQQYSPESFQTYFDETLEKFSTSGKNGNNYLKLRRKDVSGSLIHGITFSASVTHF